MNWWWESLSGSTKRYKLFSFFTFSQCQEDIAPLHSWGSLLVSEGSAYAGFTMCIIIARHIRERLGWERERKRRSQKLSVSDGKEEQRSALNYHLLTEGNLPSYSSHLFGKSAFWTCCTTYNSLITFLCLLSAICCLKVPFWEEI